MKAYSVGDNVISKVDLLDAAGNVITPTGVTFQVLDETDTTISGPTVMAGPWTTPLTTTVAGSLNSTIGARRVEYTVETLTGIVILDDTYLIRQGQRIIFLTNSMQTLTQALVTADTMSKITSWQGASEDDRVTALIEAYRRLTQLSYLIKFPQFVDLQNFLTTDWTWRITPQMWPVMTVDLFSRYPASFATALRVAQVCEANQVLTDDPIGDKIAAGLFSETVGQSSMMFRSGVRPMRLIVARPTMDYLAGYLDNRMTITRS